MPNDVYRAAVDGLSGLVAPRAARRLVDDALAATSRTSDDVSLSAMRQLLLGRIRRELETVLPPGAAGPGLKRVAAALDAASRPKRRWWDLGGRRSPRPDGTDVPEGDDVLIHEVAGRNSLVEETGEESRAPAAVDAGAKARPEEPAPVPQEDGAGDAQALPPLPLEAAEHAAQPGVDAGYDRVDQHAAPLGRGPAPALPRLDHDLVGRALRAFGDLDSVRLVAFVRGDELVACEGEGLDAAALPRLSLATARLLAGDGSLKLFAVERASGALFLFPLEDGAMVVLTRSKVNVGAVLSARAALEEAA